MVASLLWWAVGITKVESKAVDEQATSDKFDPDEQWTLVKVSVYAIVYGQCTTEMENWLNAEPDFAEISTNTDVIGLLKLIQKNATVKNSQQEQSHVVLDALTEFLTFRQDRLTDSDYLQHFKDKLEHAERVFGPIGHDTERVEDGLIYE